MKKKLFLLMIFITPCLSWAALSGTKKAIIRKPANQPAACVPSQTEKPSSGQYSLGIKSQTEKIQYNIAEIMKKQGTCASAGQ